MSIKNRGVLGIVGLLALVGAAVFAGGCSSLPPETGPTVGIRNDSDAPLRATFWIGDRVEQQAGHRAEMSAQRTLNIAPFGTTQYKLNAFSGFETNEASFIRVQIEPIGPSFEGSTQHWFELNPPSPYTVRVYGKGQQLHFDRVGGGSMVAVPQNLWFRNSGTTVAGQRASDKYTSVPASPSIFTAPARTTKAPRPLTAASVAKPATATPAEVTAVPEQHAYPND